MSDDESAVEASPVDRALDEVRAYAAHLELELCRVRSLLRAGDRTGPRADTAGLLQEVMRDHVLPVEFTAAQAVDAIRCRGWVTSSANPTNAVRAALTRLGRSGQVVRAAHGVYRWAGLGAEGSPT